MKDGESPLTLPSPLGGEDKGEGVGECLPVPRAIGTQAGVNQLREPM